MSTEPNGTNFPCDALEQCEQLVASFDGIVWERDIQSFRFTFVSKQAECALGYDLAWWYVPDFWRSHVHPDDRDRVMELYQQATREKRRCGIEYRMIAVDGRTIWLRDTVSVTAEAGVATKLRGVMVDITDRKLVEANLQQREADLKLALDAGRLGEWNWDLVTDQITWSPFCKALYGFSADTEINLERFRSAVHPDDWPGVEAEIKKALESLGDYEAEKRVVWPDGSVHWTFCRGRVLCDAAGNRVRMTGVTIDFTERKRAEEVRQAHMRFLECMDQVNRVMHATSDLEQMLSDVLDVVLSIFDCDRAWLLYPCDPNCASWSVPMERCRAEFPGALAMGLDVPLDLEVIRVFQTVRSSSSPVQFGPGSAHPLPVESSARFSIQSQLAMAIYPRIDKPYMFGLHQCSYPRVWTPQEERLFQEIGRRLADALTSLLAYRAVRESESKLGEAQRIAHVGYWDYDPAADRIIWSDETYRIFGLSPQSCVIDKPLLRQMIPPEDWQMMEQAITEALQGGLRYDVEYRARRPDGEVRFVHSHGDVTLEKPGRPRRMFGTIQDITERRQAEDRLRASEARFRTFVDHATDAFSLHDRQGTILDVNSQACETLGYARDELIGMTPFAYAIDLDQARHEQITARLDAGEMIAFDTRHRRKDGTLFPVDVRIRPFWEDGRRFAVSLVRDISEQKRAQEALILFRSLIDNANDGIEVVDPETARYLDVNEEACRAHGYSRDEYLALTVPEIDPVIGARPWRETWEELQRFGIRVFDSQHRRKDGSVFPVEVNVSYIRLDRDYVLAVVRDITERKRAQRALVESHSLLNAVVEGTADAVFIKDLQGRYLMINSAGARALGKKVEEVIGKSDWDLFSPDTAKAIVERDRQVMATGESHIFEETATVAGGSRMFSSTKSAKRDEHGQVTGLIGIARDVTDLKRLEEQFRQAQKMEAVGRLAGGVAHDFNNLLTVINGCSELVFNRLRADDPSRELLSQIQKSGERAANLTRQLLAFSRKQVLQPQVVSLNSLVRELLKFLKRLIGEDIEIALVPGAALGLTKIDPGQFEQAVINLAVNARDAMPQGGRLTIETRNVDLDGAYAEHHPEVKPGRYVLVSVSDSGHGMDDATKVHIFEPFFTTKGPGKGTGLGLSIVYGFVKQSEGHIEVYSEMGHGTTFKVYLPRASETAPSRKSSPTLVKLPKGTETVLLVEDEDGVRALGKAVLQSGGYKVLEARNGQEAIRVAQEHAGPIHILVTDMVMPRMSGRQLVDLLAPMRPKMGILFVSGYTDEVVLRHDLLGAGVAFLEKPFTPISLARKIREVLDTKGKPKETS
jgi:PAS domain S-box-containing protein